MDILTQFWLDARQTETKNKHKVSKANKPCLVSTWLDTETTVLPALLGGAALVPSALHKPHCLRKGKNVASKEHIFQQAEQTWLWRQGGSVYTSNKGDVHTWGFCGTWAVAQSTKSWSWESLWRPFTTLGNFKEYHHNSKTPSKCHFTLFFCLPIVLAVPSGRLQPSHRLGEGVGWSRCAHLDHLLLTHQASASLWLWIPQDISGGWPPL